MTTAVPDDLILKEVNNFKDEAFAELKTSVSVKQTQKSENLSSLFSVYSKMANKFNYKFDDVPIQLTELNRMTKQEFVAFINSILG